MARKPLLNFCFVTSPWCILDLAKEVSASIRLEVWLSRPIRVFVLDILGVECVDLEQANTWVACFHGGIVALLLSASIVKADSHNLRCRGSNGVIEILKGFQLEYFAIVRVVDTATAVASQPVFYPCLVIVPGVILDLVEQVPTSVSSKVRLCGSVGILLLDIIRVERVHLV